jgi:starch synthase
MKILMAASEAVPFIKTGGLADVAGSLARMIRSRGHALRIVMPLYEDIPDNMREKMKYLTCFNTPLAWRNQYCGVFQATIGGVIYYFLDNEYYFKRKGIYGFFDDAERFAFFSRAVPELVRNIDFEPDIIHCNDWQTALIPVYLDIFYRMEEKLRRTKTVFTIHNVQYQGTFDKAVIRDIIGLPEGTHGIVEYHGDANFMKGAIEQCDALTTVSPTYSQELLDPWFAHGLDPLLREKQFKLRGILNGIDRKLYDPQKAPHPIPEEKDTCKEELQARMGLAADPGLMLIGMVSRLVGHKGLDLVRAAFDRMMELPVQLVVLGSGDPIYELFLQECMDRYPGRVSVYFGFNGDLADKIYQSADAFLMPSRSEPCGLAQMIAMRYATLPIVRLTGGLRDSVRDFGGENGNGYTFLTYNPDDMLGAISRAVNDFKDPQRWRAHMDAAIACDFGWGKSAEEYIALYKELICE